MAIARSLPALTCGNAIDVVMNVASVCPEIAPVIASGEPLYGMWANLTLASILNNSPAR